jgi:rfaE bifunctional protein kinase chain/domain
MQLSDIDITRILQRCRDLKVMVIGDLMLDRYLWGNVTRISPEAPVPIINIEDEDVRFGGAANVANNLIGLNVKPVVVGVVGADKWGEMFREKLLEKSLQTAGLIVDESRPTTIKTRIIGNNQHIARVDREKSHPISHDTFAKIADFIESEIPKVDAIILEDYNKGLLTVELIEKAVSLAQQHNKIITVDPKFDNFLAYRNVTVFKPNRKETAEALAMRVESEPDIRMAGKKLLEILQAQNVLITLGAMGMALFEANGNVFFMPTHARKVADVSGAGDTVIATLTSVLAANGDIKEAVVVANVAAGVVCEEVGAVPITAEKLHNAFIH